MTWHEFEEIAPIVIALLIALATLVYFLADHFFGPFTPRSRPQGFEVLPPAEAEPTKTPPADGRGQAGR